MIGVFVWSWMDGFSEFGAPASSRGCQPSTIPILTIYWTSPSNIASSWGQYEPEAAGDWALSLPEGKTREQAVSNLARNWARNDSMAASEWIGDLPAGSMRDKAIQPLVSTIQEDDPEAAFAWALSMSDDSQRQKSLRNVVSQWAKQDADSAAFAVQSADLPEETVKHLSPNR